MSSCKTKYKVELLCASPQWWRFNIYIVVVGYDSDGNKVSFDDLTDRIYELEYGGPVREAPAGYQKDRLPSVVSGECDYVEIYVYAVANTLPTSEIIKDTPAFDATLRVYAGGKTLLDKDYEVNPWGGMTVVALRVRQE